MKNILNKKIGIMTFHNVDNYGAQLQAFALQSKCKEYCNDVNIINYIENNKENIKNENKYFTYFKVLLNNKFKLKTFFSTQSARKQSKTKFEEFRKTKLNITKQKYYDFEDLKNMGKYYDAFICGSDMVWTDIGQNLDAYFLKFTEYDKRLSYAPSLTGTSKLSTEDNEKMKDNINGIKYLSCREKEGVDYVKKICNKNAFLALDPTLLYNKKEWKKLLEITENKSKDYILCYMFKGVPNNIKKELERIAKERKLEIRYIPMNIEEYNSELKNGYIGGYGPKEFVELFLNASFIITNSFHGLLFSLIAEKPFVVFHREIDNKWSANEERMSNILKLIKQQDRFINLNQKIDERFLNNDEQKNISEIIQTKREESIKYLQKALDSVKQIEKSKIKIDGDNIEIISKKLCTGCSTCYAVCPFNAISMIENEEGFLYPRIYTEKCKKCKKCIINCPAMNEIKEKKIEGSYYGYSKNPKRNKSASGGAFYTIANYFLEKKDAYVYGATLDDAGVCKHICVKNSDELYKLQNSKYIQSNVVGIYREIKEYLDKEKVIFFSGTPCQVDGLKTFLNKEYENLYTIDIVCHGVPSPKFWSKYLEKEKITYRNKDNPAETRSAYEITFRNKDNPAETRSAFELKFSKKQSIKKIPASKDVYYCAFQKNDSFRMSCYYCKYANINRIGDITLGDCDSWRVQERFKDEEAKSIILINSKKGFDMWNLTQNMFEYRKLDVEKEIMVNGPLREPSTMTARRNLIYKDLDTMNWKEFNEKYKPKNSFVILKKIVLKTINNKG